MQLCQSASTPPITKSEPPRLSILPHFDPSFRSVFLIPLQIRRRFSPSQKTGSTHHDPHRNINGRSRASTQKIDFTNNLIKKYPTSAAAAIFNTEIVFLDGDDHSRPLKNGGVKNWWGSTTISCWGSATR